jgi:hypothetical protein
MAWIREFVVLVQQLDYEHEHEHDGEHEKKPITTRS